MLVLIRVERKMKEGEEPRASFLQRGTLIIVGELGGFRGQKTSDVSVSRGELTFLYFLSTGSAPISVN